MDVVTGLPYRLRRRPSPWVVVLQRLAFSTVWNGFFAVFVFLTWHHRSETPIFIQAILAFFVLCGIGMLWDLVVRVARTLEGKTAVVEVDKQPAQRGEALHVRVSQKDLASLAALQLGLIGESTVTETRGNTTITTTSRCYQQEIFNYAGNELVDAVLDRDYTVTIPTSGPRGEIRWAIAVNQELKQGGVDIQSFPLQVSR